ncbi:MAG: Gmad2 immunoglobulin-like domain-containing protein, partial [Chloroflexota bacterium]
RAAAELARLQISTEDEFGRLQAVMSVHVLLQSGGRDVINPSGGTGERAWLSSPLAGSQVTGGEVVVSGKFRPFNEESFIIELLDQDGRVLGTRVLELGVASDPDGYIPFSTTVPYSVSAPTPAKLVLRQADPRITGLMYLLSLELILNP